MDYRLVLFWVWLLEPPGAPVKWPGKGKLSLAWEVGIRGGGPLPNELILFSGFWWLKPFSPAKVVLCNAPAACLARSNSNICRALWCLCCSAKASAASGFIINSRSRSCCCWAKSLTLAGIENGFHGAPVAPGPEENPLVVGSVGLCSPIMFCWPYMLLYIWCNSAVAAPVEARLLACIILRIVSSCLWLSFALVSELLIWRLLVGWGDLFEEAGWFGDLDLDRLFLLGMWLDGEGRLCWEFGELYEPFDLLKNKSVEAYSNRQGNQQGQIGRTREMPVCKVLLTDFVILL